MKQGALGERLYAYRRKSKLKQAEVGAAVHLSRQAVSSHENGKSLPTMDIVRGYAQLYGISVNTLIEGTELDNALFDTEEAAGRSQAEKDMLWDYRFLPDEIQDIYKNDIHKMRTILEKYMASGEIRNYP